MPTPYTHSFFFTPQPYRWRRPYRVPIPLYIGAHTEYPFFLLYTTTLQMASLAHAPCARPWRARLPWCVSKGCTGTRIHTHMGPCVCLLDPWPVALTDLVAGLSAVGHGWLKHASGRSMCHAIRGTTADLKSETRSGLQAFTSVTNRHNRLIDTIDKSIRAYCRWAAAAASCTRMTSGHGPPGCHTFERMSRV